MLAHKFFHQTEVYAGAGRWTLHSTRELSLRPLLMGLTGSVIRPISVSPRACINSLRLGAIGPLYGGEA